MLEAVIFTFTIDRQPPSSSMFFMDPVHRMELCYILDDVKVDYRVVVPKVGNEPLSISLPTLQSLEQLLEPAQNLWGGFEVPKDHEKLKTLFKGLKAMEAMSRTAPQEETLSSEPHVMTFAYVIPSKRCTLRRIPVSMYTQTFAKLPFMYTATNSDKWSFLLDPANEPILQQLKAKTFCCVKTFHVAVNGLLAFFFHDKMDAECCLKP